MFNRIKSTTKRLVNRIDGRFSQMPKPSDRLARLPKRFQWTAHNLVAHPISEVAYQCGFENMSNYVHDRTVPRHTSGTGHG